MTKCRFKALPSLVTFGIVIILVWCLGKWYLSPSRLFSPWLGPQNIERVQSLSRWQQAVESRMKDYDVAVAVESGKNIKIPIGLEDQIVVCVDGKIVATKTCHIDPSKKYVVGKFSLTSATGRRIYSLNIRVTRGPLKGAVIHLRDNLCPETIEGPFWSVYEVPSNLPVPLGPLEFEYVPPFYSI